MITPITFILFFVLWVLAVVVGFHIGLFYAIRNIYVQVVEIQDMEGCDDD